MPAFSDWGFIALGVPRNASIAKPGSFDLGLCGPMRTDLASHREYCGRFRTPTLRNVAQRQVFFHNGSVKSLEQAVRFYAERDTKPERWYPVRGGKVVKYDDLPANLRGNVHNDAPFGSTKPTLSDDDVRDIVEFLRTLNDGYRDVSASASASRRTPG